MTETQNTNNKPIEKKDKPGNVKKSLFNFYKLLMLQKRRVLMATFSNIIASICYAIVPWVAAIAIDRVIVVLKKGMGEGVLSALTETLKVPIIILLILSALAFILNYFQEYLMASVGELTTLALRKQVTAKLTHLPLSYYDETQVGALLSTMSADVDKISELIVTGFNQFVFSVVAITSGVVLLIIINRPMTVVVLLVVFAGSFVTKYLSKKNQQLYTKNMETLGDLSNTVEEYLSGNTLIKAYNQQESAIETVEEKIEKQYKAQRAYQFINFAVYPIIRGINYIAFIASAVWGGLLVVQGAITVGVLQAYLQYVLQISDPITEASYIINSLQATLAAVERTHAILDLPEESSDEGKNRVIEQAKGKIEFKHVQFGYTPDKMIMENVSFVAEPDETIAIVGPTGAGKTTLVNLLMRFYDVNSGEILFDDVDTQDLSRKELRSHFGMVLQDTWLFEGTVADNIAYGKMDASREEVVEVSKVAQCDHFIRTLPQGYDTVISSDGSTISQGQQQLLTITRTMLANPRVMILDEATSSIDTKTEAIVQKAISKLLANRTSFVIAHRLSTIQNAHLILVMDKGNIIETGTHKELLAEKGFYADLYASQFSAS